jgi:hypothetical protein
LPTLQEGAFTRGADFHLRLPRYYQSDRLPLLIAQLKRQRQAGIAVEHRSLALSPI